MHDRGDVPNWLADSPATAAEAILVSDIHGQIRFVNRNCTNLLECDPRVACESTCWEIARMRSPDGIPFCGPDCPVQREIRSGRVPAPMHLVRPSRNGNPVDIRVVTVPIHQASGRCALLHLLAPNPPRPTREAKPAATDTDRFGRLSGRECEILDLIARGFTSRDIARKLFISIATVNNHVQSLLRKLELHRRIDAAFMWFRDHP